MAIVYEPLNNTHRLYKAFYGPQGDLFHELKKYYGDKDLTNDLYYDLDGTMIKIDPSKTLENGSDWMKYNIDENQPFIFDPTKFYTMKVTPYSGAFNLNSKSAPVATNNNNTAYTYKEWMNNNPWNQNAKSLQTLANIYGDIDTLEEFNTLKGLGSNARVALLYINNNYRDSKGNSKPLFDDNYNYIGTTNEDLQGAAALLNEYLTTDVKGKELATQLLRGQATLPSIARYQAYSGVKKDTNGWKLDDIDWLNNARNSVDKKYRGANFFMNHAGDDVWGNLAQEFAQNNLFRDTKYTVNAEHVKNRLNRDAGLGDGRTLILVYNDIIKNIPSLSEAEKYSIFRDMTRRRFKLNDDFWNKKEHGLWQYADTVRREIGGDNAVYFKQGGKIFNMLFV